MKKLFAAILALCMLFSVALAETVSLNWADFLPVLEAGNVEGDFVTFDEVAVKMWLPSGLNAVELTDEDREQGYIAYFTSDDESATVSVVYVDVNGMSLEDYTAHLTEYGATEIEAGTVNGLDCVSYKNTENDSLSLAFSTEAGYILEVTCAPASEEGAELVWGAVAASIQPE